MSEKKLEFDIKLNEKDIWIFSLYSSNRAYLGIFNALFTLASLYVLVSTWGESGISRKLVFLACALMFSVIQPAILYLKAARQAKTEMIKKGFKLELSEENIVVTQDKNVVTASWEEVYKTMIRKNMIVIYFAPLRGYLIPARYFEGNREKLEALLKEKTMLIKF